MTEIGILSEHDHAVHTGNKNRFPARRSSAEIFAVYALTQTHHWFQSAMYERFLLLFHDSAPSPTPCRMSSYVPITASVEQHYR